MLEHDKIEKAIKELKENQLLIIIYYSIDNNPVILISHKGNTMYWHITESDMITLYNMLDVIVHDGVELTAMNNIWITIKNNLYKIMINDTSVSFAKDEVEFFLNKLEEFIEDNIKKKQ